MTDGCHEATITGAQKSDCLVDHHQQLEKEDEEKYHKIETGIIAECFVRRTIPEIIEKMGNKLLLRVSVKSQKSKHIKKKFKFFKFYSVFKKVPV